MSSKEENKILVAIPTNIFKLPFYGKLRYALKNMEGNFEIIFSDDSLQDNYAIDVIDKDFNWIRLETPLEKHYIERIADQRNNLLEYFWDHPEYTHIFFLDSDVIPPKDIIPRLLKHDKEIITGIYFSKMASFSNQEIACVFTSVDEYSKGLRSFNYFNLSNLLDWSRPETLKAVVVSGFGCMMISKKATVKVGKFRHDLNYPMDGEDVNWCMDAAKEGYKIYADTSCFCNHYDKSEKELEFYRMKSKFIGDKFMGDKL